MALHVPLVQEKLGCLIPADLHPRLDGKKPKQNPGAVAAASAVELCCGSWKLKLCEEHALHEKRPLPKGLVEFFGDAPPDHALQAKLSLHLESINPEDDATVIALRLS